MRALVAEILSTGVVVAARIWSLPDRVTVGMMSFMIAESAIFTIFVVAHLFYLGKRMDCVRLFGLSY
jgi:hypothetical protein